jgi:magnesium-transporting ATPase (P-type)
VPFSSALNSRYGGVNAVWMWYSFNMFMIGISLYLLWKYVGNPKKKLSYIADDSRLRKMSSTRSLTIAIIFLMGLLLCLLNWEPAFWIARFVYVLIFPAMLIINRVYPEKKQPAL